MTVLLLQEFLMWLQRKSQLRSGSGRSFCHGPGQQSPIHPQQSHSAVTDKGSSTRGEGSASRLEYSKFNESHLDWSEDPPVSPKRQQPRQCPRPSKPPRGAARVTSSLSPAFPVFPARR